MLRNLSGKHREKFPATTRSYSMVKIARLNDGFSEIFELEASPVEGQSLPQTDNKRRKRKGKHFFLKNLKSPKTVIHVRVSHFLVQKLPVSPNFDFFACPSKNVVKLGASAKKGMLSKCLFD